MDGALKQVNEAVPIMMLTELEYDNPILNNQEALYKFYHKFGSDATNALISVGELMFQGLDDSAAMHVVGDSSTADVHDA